MFVLQLFAIFSKIYACENCLKIYDWEYNVHIKCSSDLS